MARNEHPEDLLERLGVTAQMRRIIARSAAEFESTARWVTFDVLAYEAAERGERFDLDVAFRLPSVLGGVWSGEQVCLTGLGVLCSGAAPRTAALMAQLAEICSERKLRLRDDAEVGREILVDEYGFDEDVAAGAVEVIALVPGIGGGGALGENWLLSIHRTALHFLDVHNVEDLTKHLAREAEDRIAAHRVAIAAAPTFYTPPVSFSVEMPSPPIVQVPGKAPWWKPDLGSIRDNLVANLIWAVLVTVVVAVGGYLFVKG